MKPNFLDNGIILEQAEVPIAQDINKYVYDLKQVDGIPEALVVGQFKLGVITDEGEIHLNEHKSRQLEANTKLALTFATRSLINHKAEYCRISDPSYQDADIFLPLVEDNIMSSARMIKTYEAFAISLVKCLFDSSNTMPRKKAT